MNILMTSHKSTSVRNRSGYIRTAAGTVSSGNKHLLLFDSFGINFLEDLASSLGLIFCY